MANLFQAYRNIRKYGLRNAIKGALQTPGGYLDATLKNPNNQLVASVQTSKGNNAVVAQDQSTRRNSLRNNTYFDPSTGLWYEWTAPQTQGPGGDYPIAGGKPATTSMSYDDEYDGSGSGTAVEEYQPEYHYLYGQAFDLNNPEQRRAYFDAYKSALAQEYNTQIGGINTDLTNLGQSRLNAGAGFVRQGIELGQGYDQGTVSRGQYYASLSPNAYQSSQGSSQLFAHDKLLEGQGDIQNAATQAEQQYGTQEKQLMDERTALAAEYQSQLDRAAEGLTGADVQQGGRALNYNRQAYNPYTPPSVDLGNYTPYTTFTKPTGQQVAPVGAYTTPQEDFSYLGYTPSQKEKDLLRRYLVKGY